MDTWKILVLLGGTGAFEEALEFVNIQLAKHDDSTQPSHADILEIKVRLLQWFPYSLIKKLRFLTNSYSNHCSFLLAQLAYWLKNKFLNQYGNACNKAFEPSSRSL